MRIGLTGGATTMDKMVEQAIQAEADGFSALWYASAVAGDPLAVIAVAGRATTRIELGTAVLQTYPCHPLLQAQRAASVTKAMGRAGFTLGIGPSHDSIVRDVYGLTYDHPGADTEEYVGILTALLRGETVVRRGKHWSVNSTNRAVPPDHPVPVLLAALGPRLLRVAGEGADGTILWLATAPVIESHVVPRITAAADAAGRPAPRIIAGLPVAVHDDPEEARAAQAGAAALYAQRPNYQRMVELAGASSAAEVAIVGDEASVAAQLQGLLDAGATEVHAAIFPVGQDREARRASMRRTRELLASLAERSTP